MTAQPTNPADTTELCRQAIAGRRVALARLISGIENGTVDLTQLCAAVYPRVGGAVRIGLTGPPGAGKSTMAGALARCLRAAGKSVAVLAVDPSSPLTGGAVLGDRVRMLDLPTGDGLFIRSLGARGHLGGLSARTLLTADLLDAVGNDVVLIETVGVGQSEIEIAALADVTVVVLAPGFGDDVQGIKAGILEVADVFVVNKADHPGARQLVGTLQALSRGPSGGKPVPVLECVARDGRGVPELAALFDREPRPAAAQALGADRLGRMLRELAADELRRRIGRLDEATLRRLAERLLSESASADSLVDAVLDAARQPCHPAPAPDDQPGRAVRP